MPRKKLIYDEFMPHPYAEPYGWVAAPKAPRKPRKRKPKKASWLVPAFMGGAHSPPDYGEYPQASVEDKKAFAEFALNINPERGE